MEKIRTWLMFVGYGRSGHSFIGSALDAHPNVCIAHEADAVRRSLDGEFESAGKLFEYLNEHEKEILASGRLTDNRWGEPYRQSIQGQLKPDLSSVTVIGNKNGSIETGNDLRAFEERLSRFESFLGSSIQVKFLCVLRNPFDSGLLDPNVYRLLQALSERFSERFLLLRHEDFVQGPRRELGRLCEFLDVPFLESHFEAVEARAFKKVQKSRYKIDYSESEISLIKECINGNRIFKGYSYED